MILRSHRWGGSKGISSFKNDPLPFQAMLFISIQMENEKEHKRYVVEILCLRNAPRKTKYYFETFGKSIHPFAEASSDTKILHVWSGMRIDKFQNISNFPNRANLRGESVEKVSNVHC